MMGWPCCALGSLGEALSLGLRGIGTLSTGTNTESWALGGGGGQAGAVPGNLWGRRVSAWGGGGGDRAPENGGGGFGKRAQLT